VAVPTIDVGLNNIPTSALTLLVAGKLVSAVLSNYWQYLGDNAIQDDHELRKQQENWAALELTDAELTYLSKHNLGFTGQVHTARLNSKLLSGMISLITDQNWAKVRYLSCIQAMVAALNETEFIRVVIHFGTTHLTEGLVLSFIQRTMDVILEWGTHNPSACRVELLFKGKQGGTGGLTSLLTTPLPDAAPKVNLARQNNWKIYDNCNWAAEFVAETQQPHGPKFAKLNSRFGLRVEMEEKSEV
jgi:hypothetical protein